MLQLLRAMIAGAGSPAVATATPLNERGREFVCSGTSGRVAAVWVFGDRNGASGNSKPSRDRMQLSDFPMSRSSPDFARHARRSSERLRAAFELPVARTGRTASVAIA